MKTTRPFLFIVFLLLLAGSTGTALADDVNFAVLSDPHLYDTSLGTTGEAFEIYLMQDRKLIRESEAILSSAIASIIEEDIDFLIIPGDLTKDGELASHTLMAEYLKMVEDSGVQVFVAPGNHDINNPQSFAYDGATTTPVPNVTPAMFRSIYGPYGYNQAIFSDPNSLSYIASPRRGIWILAMDSCDYENNQDAGHSVTAGRFKEETLNWILSKLALAKKLNIQVIGIMHHGLIEHYTGQSRMFSEYVISDWERVSGLLAEAGLKIVFTGHYHANDITQKSWEVSGGEATLTDVETGSLVTYPSPYRLVTVHGHNAVSIRTRTVQEIEYDTAGLDFPEYAEMFLRQGLLGIATYSLTLPVESGGYGLSADQAAYIAPYVVEAFVAHYKGDEAPDQATLQFIQALLQNPASAVLGSSLYTLWTDLSPQDNGAIIPLYPRIQLSLAGTYQTGIFDEGAAEIAAHDPETQRVFVVNGNDNAIDVLNIADPKSPVKIFSINLAAYGAGPNSVAVQNGLVAVAVESDPAQAPGSVVFFDTDGNYLNKVTVGALPDMLTFTPNGKKILVANEGEPSDDYTVDPEGSVSIIDLRKGPKRATVRTADFQSFNSRIDQLKADGVRIFGPGATVAQDLEPEYLAVSKNSRTAWVTLQENNAVALLDINRCKITKIIPLGYKDHNHVENKLDASNKDEAVNIRSYENLFGMYQPDAIAGFTSFGREYLITANEGDARDYDAFSEEARVKDLDLDPNVFAPEIQDSDLLGRLNITTTMGDQNGDGLYESLYAYGARSFSIWKQTFCGLKLVFDSGDQLEKITAAALPYHFNSTNDENGSFDNRSDDKGPEPEGVTVGKIGRRTYAFIGLERVGGVMVYDITFPKHPIFVQYINNRDFTGDPEAGTAGDLGPEGLIFISGSDSPSGVPLLVVSNEISGSTSIFEITLNK